MHQTQTEKRISHRRKRSGVLVPLLEDMFTAGPVDFTLEDVEWIDYLLKSMVERGENRGKVFSPSQLSSCLRHVYLLRNHKNLGIEKKRLLRPEANYYFFKGNWTHIMWQFALHRLDELLPDSEFKLLGVEVPVISKRKDHGGTVDAIVAIKGEIYIVDFKGLNVRSFGEITRGYIPPDYAVQISDYAMMFSSQRVGPLKITNGLLIVENKGGPDNKHPIALHEAVVEIRTYIPEVRSRVEVLRQHEKEGEVPPPECTTTQGFQFIGCPFSKYCRKEVRAIQQRASKSENSKGYKVAIPGRNGHRSPRRNSKR